MLVFELAPIIVQIALVLSSLRNDWDRLEGKEALVRLRASGMMHTQSAILTEDESVFSSNDDG